MDRRESTNSALSWRGNNPGLDKLYSMKILMLNEIRDWGGGEVLTLDLARALIRAGVDLTLGCNRDSVLLERAESTGIPALGFPMRNEIDIFAVMYLVGLIQRDKYQLVHCHTMRDHVLGSLAAKYSGQIPVVRTQHIHFPENPSFLAQLAYNKWTDRVICNSDFIKGDLEKAGMEKGKLVTVHNGMELERLSGTTEKTGGEESFRREIGYKEGEILIGCAGSLFETKGQHHLINAFPGILEKIPTCRLVIVGDGPQREYLKDLVRKNRVEEKVVFTGYRDDIPNILNSLDMMVIPSVWQEPFGLVVVEAMFGGIPVIASDVGGIPEIIKNNITGELFPAGNEEALTAAVLKILCEEELRRKIITNAKARVMEYFNSDRMAREVIEVYDTLKVK